MATGMKTTSALVIGTQIGKGPPLVDFIRYRDIYALGLILLEIGVWQPLSALSEEGQ